jgi:hypothetical protein
MTGDVHTYSCLHAHNVSLHPVLTHAHTGRQQRRYVDHTTTNNRRLAFTSMMQQLIYKAQLSLKRTTSMGTGEQIQSTCGKHAMRA